MGHAEPLWSQWPPLDHFHPQGFEFAHKALASHVIITAASHVLKNSGRRGKQEKTRKPCFVYEMKPFPCEVKEPCKQLFCCQLRLRLLVNADVYPRGARSTRIPWEGHREQGVILTLTLLFTSACPCPLASATLREMQCCPTFHWAPPLERWLSDPQPFWKAVVTHVEVVFMLSQCH